MLIHWHYTKSWRLVKYQFTISYVSNGFGRLSLRFPFASSPREFAVGVCGVERPSRGPRVRLQELASSSLGAPASDKVRLLTSARAAQGVPHLPPEAEAPRSAPAHAQSGARRQEEGQADCGLEPPSWAPILLTYSRDAGPDHDHHRSRRTGPGPGE